VSSESVFQPPRRLGSAIQVIAALSLAIMGGVGLWQAFNATIGPAFLLYLLIFLLAAALIPVLAYRTYALLGAYYALERDGIHLHWGLRSEDIPMDTVLWVRQASEMGGMLRLPWVRWPGSVLGMRHLADGSRIEFLASTSNQMILIATSGQVFAISPEDANAFLHSFQRLTELGSLTPLPAHSVHPSFLLARIWKARIARYLLLLGLALSLILLAWVSLIVPTHEQIILGPFSHGEPVPSVQLLLLPVLNAIIFLVDLILGMFFFRLDGNRSPFQARSAATLPQLDRMPLNGSLSRVQDTSFAATSDNPLRPFSWLIPSTINSQILAYLLWGSGALSPLLFLLAVFFILQGG
jgi:hypothetical protein